MQRSDDFAALLVSDLCAPLGVECFQSGRHSIVLPDPQRVKGTEWQHLVHPAVPRQKALHPLAPRPGAAAVTAGLLEARRRGVVGNRRQEGPPAVIGEPVIDSQQAGGAGSVPQQALQSWAVSIHGGGVQEGSNRVGLLPLEHLLEVAARATLLHAQAGRRRTEERKTALPPKQLLLRGDLLASKLA